MRYRLRTLLILLAVGPPVLAWTWREYHWWKKGRDLEERMSANNTDWASMGVVPPKMWPDLTLRRTPIIQVDLGNEDQPTP